MRSTHANNGGRTLRRDYALGCIQDDAGGFCLLIREAAMHPNARRHSREVRAIEILSDDIDVRQIGKAVIISVQGYEP